MKSSRLRSLAPPALETRCHLIASTGSAGRPRPTARMRASRFCAIGAALARSLLQKRRGRGLVLGDAGAVEQAMAYSTWASVLSASAAAARRRVRLGQVLGHAAAFLVHRRERVLRFRTAGVSGDAEHLGGAFEILSETCGLRDRACRDYRRRGHGRAWRRRQEASLPLHGWRGRRGRLCGTLRA